MAEELEPGAEGSWVLVRDAIKKKMPATLHKPAGLKGMPTVVIEQKKKVVTADKATKTNKPAAKPVAKPAAAPAKK